MIANFANSKYRYVLHIPQIQLLLGFSLDNKDFYIYLRIRHMITLIFKIIISYKTYDYNIGKNSGYIRKNNPRYLTTGRMLIKI